MTLKGMYDQIAQRYNTANWFGSISQSHQVAIEQIKALHLHQRDDLNVLDLGVGNGHFLNQLAQFLPKAHFTGIDISPKMLEIAKASLPMVTIESSAGDACRFLPPHSQDLVLAHFVNAYIPIPVLFEQARLLTKASGYFSMISTTYDSFQTAQSQLASFIAQDSLVSRVVGHYYKNIVKNATVAAGQAQLLQAFDQHQFNIIAHQRIEIPITLNSIDELIQFGVEGTWFLNSLTIRMLPKNFLRQRLKKLFSHIFTFPYHDTHVIDIVLANK